MMLGVALVIPLLWVGAVYLSITEQRLSSLERVNGITGATITSAIDTRKIIEIWDRLDVG